MLKKMRWHFIRAAMIAFGTVIFLLMCAVNLWSYHIMVQQQDSTLYLLYDFDQEEDITAIEPEEFQIPGPFAPFSEEMQYMTRFFTVYCDADGAVTEVKQDFIVAVTREDAGAYAKAVLAGGKAHGYYRNYRYLSVPTDLGTTIIFLNVERETQTMKSLLLVSGTIALISILAVFTLLFFFSRKAIAPYVRNMEMQKQFITDAGHELKTPLTSIATSADILAMDQPDNEWVGNIQAQSVRLSKLIANLVTLSRLDEEQPLLEKAEFSLSDAVWEISEATAALAKARGKRYEAHIEDGISFFGDKNAVQQMVSILLDNAVRYSDASGNIRMDVQKKTRKVEITVFNTCALGDTKHLDRLFDRFYRPDESRSHRDGGMGIGLSIAKAVAEAHGGTISVSSRDGEDITFKISLPRR